MEMAEEILEEAGDPVGAGEHEPIVGMQLEQRVHQVLLSAGGLDFDGGNFQHFGATFLQ